MSAKAQSACQAVKVGGCHVLADQQLIADNISAAGTDPKFVLLIFCSTRNEVGV